MLYLYRCGDAKVSESNPRVSESDFVPCGCDYGSGKLYMLTLPQTERIRSCLTPLLARGQNKKTVCSGKSMKSEMLQSSNTM